MIYRFIEVEKATFTIAFLCARLGVSRSGFYDWRRRQVDPSARAREDAVLTETIVEIHRQSRGTYGSPLVHAELVLGMGMRIGRKRVERLMRNAAIQGVTRRRRHGCTRPNPEAVPSDDLVNRAFRPAEPGSVVGRGRHPASDG